MHFLADLTYWHWFTLSIILLLIELILTNTGFLLWIAIASSVTGFSLVLFPTLLWPYQLLIFVVISLLYAPVGKKYIRLHPIKSDRPTLNKRNQQYIGRVFTLNKSIENGRGSIHVDDSIWNVSGPDLPAGTQVKVVGAEGSILKVEAV